MNKAQIKNYQPPNDLLKDRVILVTGASSGIGSALAKASAHYGATVILLARNMQKLEQVYDAIEAEGAPEPAIYPLNLETATLKDYDDLGDNLQREFGHLDGLVNNAGWVSGLTPINQYDADRWMRVMTVNLHAPFLLTKVCLPLLEQAHDPNIVFSTDTCTRAYWGAYGVAKHALVGFIEILAHELNSDKPIRVNGIDTGPINTKMRMENYPGEDPSTLPSPEDVINPYLYFLGHDSRGETGQNLILNTP